MATKKTFDFRLGDQVRLLLSSEQGEIIGQSRYSNASPSYFVRYLAGDGRQTENWISEEALVLLSRPEK